MTIAGTKLSLNRIQAEAAQFGLAPEDFSALTIHEFDNGAQITAYPGGNTRSRQFLEHLIHQGLAERRR